MRYTISVPAIAVSPTQLAFTTASGQNTRPAAQSVTVSAEQDVAVGYSVALTYSGGAQVPWLDNTLVTGNTQILQAGGGE